MRKIDGHMNLEVERPTVEDALILIDSRQVYMDDHHFEGKGHLLPHLNRFRSAMLTKFGKNAFIYGEQELPDELREEYLIFLKSTDDIITKY